MYDQTSKDMYSDVVIHKGDILQADLPFLSYSGLRSKDLA